MSSPKQGKSESSPPNLCLLLGSSLSGLSGSCHALEGTSAAKVCMAPVPGDRITFLFTLLKAGPHYLMQKKRISAGSCPMPVALNANSQFL